MRFTSTSLIAFSVASTAGVALNAALSAQDVLASVADPSRRVSRPKKKSRPDAPSIGILANDQSFDEAQGHRELTAIDCTFDDGTTTGTKCSGYNACATIDANNVGCGSCSGYVYHSLWFLVCSQLLLTSITIVEGPATVHEDL